MTPEKESLSQVLSVSLRPWTAEALIQIDAAMKSRDKMEQRRLLLSVGSILESVVRELEQLLKVEPPR